MFTDEYGDVFPLSKYESSSRDYCQSFIEKLRREWELSIDNEEIPERNWRLLKELESLMLK
jgi:hypothetical protein